LCRAVIESRLGSSAPSSAIRTRPGEVTQ
jgi:hypothetical protein